MELNLFANNQIDGKRIKWVEDLVNFTADELKISDLTEVSIHFVDINEIHRINKEYRNTDRPTDVISFAIEDEEEEFMDQFDDILEHDIGDLFICKEVVDNHAKEYEHSFDRELGYTIVHGILHLSGYDHIKPEEEKEMIGLQEKVLTKFGLEK
ncbi:rRNA maturation RNase YbeY [Companilactobacillus sp. DQM5]|uniref:rRNA maturation RNase YbeY n=1 Tax=Companilactobacillus sp. DQM5 TaxID=3463359 RepID=UPI004058DB2C